MRKTPEREPTAHFHGEGWRAMLKQAEHLESNPDATHVLVQLDPDTGEPGEPFIVDNRADVLHLAELLREKARATRNARN